MKKAEELLYPKVLKKQKQCQYKCGYFSDYITADFPLIGIEPSAILTFRDEYRLADDTESAIS
jgi:hypothetical protein